MRSAAFLISVVSVALLSVLGWARHEKLRSSDSRPQVIAGEDESVLFVG